MTQIILLNGASSAGKSSIAEELQKVLLSPPWLSTGLDHFMSGFRTEVLNDEKKFFDLIEPLVKGVNRSVAALVDQRLNVIVDHIFQIENSYQDFAEVNKNHNILKVAIRCPLEVLVERERKRGDRQAGLAEFQSRLVHRGISYDLELDTSRLSAYRCAQEIVKNLQR